MKHPFLILTENISKYTKLKKEEIEQPKPNLFVINDTKFKTLLFLNDVTSETGIQPKEHMYIGASCSDPFRCFKPYTVYGFDNVLFYIKNDENKVKEEASLRQG